MTDKIILWAQDNNANSLLKESLSKHGYSIDSRLTGSSEPVVQRGKWFYHGYDNILTMPGVRNL